MRRSDDLKAIRIIACIMATVVLVVMLFSASYIAGHSHHHCTGEDCPVCACIHQCESIIKGLESSLIALVSVILPLVILSTAKSLPAILFTWGTPVSKKVRLND